MNDSNTLCKANFCALLSRGPAVKTASCASVLIQAANSGCLRKCTAISDSLRKPHLRGDRPVSYLGAKLGHDLREIHTNEWSEQHLTQTARDHEMISSRNRHIASKGVKAIAISGLWFASL